MQRSTVVLIGLAVIIVVMFAGGGILSWWASRNDEKMSWEWAADLSDPDPRVRREAAEALRDMGPEAQEDPALLKALRDEDDGVRAAAVEALVRGGSIEALVYSLRDPEGRVHRAAIVGFKMLGADGVGILCQELQSGDHQVRQRTALALAEVGPDAKDAVTALTAALKDNDSGVRQFAADALGAIGPKASRAVPALRKALEDESASVKRSSANALARIVGE